MLKSLNREKQPKLLATITEILTSHAWVLFGADQGPQSGHTKKILLKSLLFADPPVATSRTPATADVVTESTVASSSSGGRAADVDEPAPLAESIDVDASTTAAPATQAVSGSALAAAAAWADAAAVFGGDAD